jgi:hypothetical protein
MSVPADIGGVKRLAAGKPSTGHGLLLDNEAGRAYKKVVSRTRLGIATKP